MMEQPIDYKGLSLLIGALGVFFSSLVGSFMTVAVFIRQGHQIRVGDETKSLVNGQAATLAVQNEKLSNALQVTAKQEGVVKGRHDLLNEQMIDQAKAAK